MEDSPCLKAPIKRAMRHSNNIAALFAGDSIVTNGLVLSDLDVAAAYDVNGDGRVQWSEFIISFACCFKCPPEVPAPPTTCAC